MRVYMLIPRPRCVCHMQVRYIIDTGLAKVSRYDPKKGMQILETTMISRSSADQRKGRAGRTGPGMCYRLYTEDEYNSMPTSETPEILRAHLGICILQLKLLEARLPGFDSEAFDFVQQPSEDALRRAVQSLRWLGCLDACGGLTTLGMVVAQMEMDPMLCRMIIKVVCAYIFCRRANVLVLLVSCS
jgi:HrpA-like RNA helicase